MDEGNEYESTLTYVVIPDEDRPLVGSECVIVVSDGSSDDESSRIITDVHEQSREELSDTDDDPLISDCLGNVASQSGARIQTTSPGSKLITNDEW